MVLPSLIPVVTSVETNRLEPAPMALRPGTPTSVASVHVTPAVDREVVRPPTAAKPVAFPATDRRIAGTFVRRVVQVTPSGEVTMKPRLVGDETPPTATNWLCA